MTETEEGRRKSLEGYSQAHAWLRFYELGDQESIDELRRSLSVPVDYIYVSAGLAARTRKLLQQLFVTADKDLKQMHEELVRVANEDPAGSLDWEAMCVARVEIASGLAQQWNPNLQRRLDMYEKAALDGYAAE